LFFLILVLGYNVSASCNSDRLNKLIELSKKVEFSYDYIKSNGSNDEEGDYISVDFTITAYNLNQEIRPLIIYDYYNDDYREFKYNSNRTNSLSGFSSGERVKVTFKAYTDDECSGKTLYSKTINLPYYNSYYDTEECQNNRGFKYCQSELLTSSITHNQFLLELDEYLNSSDVDDPVDDNNNDENNNVETKNNEIIGMIILGILIILVIVSIVIKIKKIREKNKL